MPVADSSLPVPVSVTPDSGTVSPLTLASGTLGPGTVEPGVDSPARGAGRCGGLALQHRAELHDARHIEGLECRLLVGDGGQVDDDVLALHAHVRLGDAERLELIAHQVADTDEVVLLGGLGGGVDDRQAALEVEAEHR